MTPRKRFWALGGVAGGLLAIAVPSPTSALPLPEATTSIQASAVLRAGVEASGAREAIARVAYAEAAGQGDSGLAAVVYTILNRLAGGQWGQSVDQVVNARRQFEPVMRAGGDWRSLPPATPAQRARIDTILNLALDGRLPDLTGGALYFQNPKIVAARAASGQVAPSLVHFGGARPSIVIGDHAFYADVNRPASAPVIVPVAREADAIFFPGPSAGSNLADPEAGKTVASRTGTAAAERGLFVLPGGEIVESRP